jgi:hypothetical protein
MVTVPDAEPVARPAELTLAIFESEELHCAELVMSLVLLSERWAVAVNCCVAPMPIDIELGAT